MICPVPLPIRFQSTRPQPDFALGRPCCPATGTDLPCPLSRTRANPRRPVYPKLKLRLFAWAVATALVCAGRPSHAETVIEGTVKLPPSRTSSTAASRYQPKAGVAAVPEPPVAVVYLEGSFPAPSSKPMAGGKIEQKDYQFVPGILPVFRGSEVKFPNLDEDYHHVFSYSKPKKFDLGRYRNDENPPTVVFDKAGVIKVGCEIHDHMRAVILVLETPHFTKTGADGKYRLVLKDPLAGKFTLKAWINEKTFWEQPVEVKEGATLTIDFLGQ